jgi:DNA-binding XRE family transcriptional regulator
MKPPSTFGERMMLARHRVGLSQTAIAHELGVSRQAVSLWEKDCTQPSIGVLARLAELLDTDPNGLILGWSEADNVYFDAGMEALESYDSESAA